MADLGLAKNLRAVVGERIEHTYQVIEAYNTSLEKDPDLGARINQTDLLPALGVTWSMNKKSKLRGSATRTLARPQLRELAPFTFQDYFGGRLEGGNPDLEITNITNLDARVEYFPTLREVLAMSVFFKDFQNPIERVIIASGDEGAISYRNADSAQLLGIELEARRDLAFIAESMKDFTASTNLTIAQSRVTVEPEDILGLTNLTRPLVNQAPWVFNFQVSYSREKSGTTATVLYNVVGPRIAVAGSQGLDDVYEHPRNLLDLTVQQKIVKGLSVKLEARNILNAPVMFTQGCGSDGRFRQHVALHVQRRQGIRHELLHGRCDVRGVRDVRARQVTALTRDCASMRVDGNVSNALDQRRFAPLASLVDKFRHAEVTELALERNAA